MATLGTKTPTGGGDFFAAGEMVASPAVASGTGSIATLTIAITASGFTSLKLGIYANSGGLPGAKLGETGTTSDNTAGEKVLNLLTPVPVVDTTTYHVGLLALGGDVNFNDVTGGSYRGTGGQSGFADPFGTPGFTDTNNGLPILGESSGGGGGDATVTAVPAAVLGDAPNPTVVASSNVTGPVADATGTAPAPANRIDIEIVTGPASATGDAPNPTVSAGTNSTVTPPVADGTGAAPVPSVQAGATPAPPVADATGTAPAPTVSGSQAGQVSPPAADGTGAAPAPVIHAGQTVGAPVADALGDALAPTGVGEPVTHFPGAPIGFQNTIVFPEPVDTRIAAFHPVDTVLAAAYVPDTELAPA